jgi:hypothetical protein
VNHEANAQLLRRCSRDAAADKEAAAQPRGGSETGSVAGSVPGSVIGSVYEELEAESASYGAALADGFDSDGGGRRGLRDMLRRTAGPPSTEAQTLEARSKAPEAGSTWAGRCFCVRAGAGCACWR